jgi:polysaccharide export outer membrane protein
MAMSRSSQIKSLKGAAIRLLALAGAAAIPLSPAAAQIVAPRADLEAPQRYHVKSGDQLEVFVWGEERMQRSVRVQPDGTFAFPLAGTIRAEGRSVSDISTEIRERIAVNYRSAPPDVTVTVGNATEMRFYVVGKVRTPGSYTSPDTVNIVQALSMAGGAAEFADIKNAVILRQSADGSQVVEPVKLTTVLKGRRALRAGALANALPTLGSGDVLVIP